jgi:hypothetical protein
MGQTLWYSRYVGIYFVDKPDRAFMVLFRAFNTWYTRTERFSFESVKHVWFIRYSFESVPIQSYTFQSMQRLYRMDTRSR